MGAVIKGNFGIHAGVIAKPYAAPLYDGDLFTNADGTPRLWWARPALWAERELADSITRPCEDRAILNVYLQARALGHVHEYSQTLDAFEFRAFTLEKEAKEKYPHLSGWTLYEWIAERMAGFDGEWTPRRVKGLLDNVSDIVQAAEMERLLALVEAERKRGVVEFKAVVREVMAENAAETWARRAA